MSLENIFSESFQSVPSITECAFNQLFTFSNVSSNLYSTGKNNGQIHESKSTKTKVLPTISNEISKPESVEGKSNFSISDKKKLGLDTIESFDPTLDMAKRANRPNLVFKDNSDNIVLEQTDTTLANISNVKSYKSDELQLLSKENKAEFIKEKRLQETLQSPKAIRINFFETCLQIQDITNFFETEICKIDQSGIIFVIGEKM